MNNKAPTGYVFAVGLPLDLAASVHLLAAGVNRQAAYAGRRALCGHDLPARVCHAGMVGGVTICERCLLALTENQESSANAD